VLNRQRSHPVSRAELGGFLESLVHAMRSPARSLAVCLVSDRRMREYNRRYRGQDRTTDVLSFPAGPTAENEHHLGDIVISVPAAERQARQARHSLARELKILALHGYLHLLGYDHETDDGEMMRLQHDLIRRLLRRRAGGACA